MAEEADDFTDMSTDQAQTKQSTKEKKQASGSRSRWTYVHFFVTGCLTVGLAGSIGINCIQAFTSLLSVAKDELDILTRFPGHFMDEDTMNKTWVGFPFYHTVPNITGHNVTGLNGTDHTGVRSFEKGKPPENNGKPAGCTITEHNRHQWSYNACCYSRSYIQNLTQLDLTVEDHGMSIGTIVQGIKDGDEFIYQYFEIQECCHFPDCTGGTCSQTDYVTSALIFNPNPNEKSRYKVAKVRVPGCCKCMNF
eukprot:TRINITY_DN64599_c0_g1_i1.p1 TRINITY_DN64599_c0_g1~~TRINITY_DN64599_c0_g1_i1.p1  ORF type:complete len:251 (+),score=28.41 TRINITY_DN64599_c0_g1_i1:144-896(+)